MAETNLSAFIWSVADLLRGDYKQSDYGKVILPFTVLRRLDCVLEPTKAAVLEEKALREGQGLDPEPWNAVDGCCGTTPLRLCRRCRRRAGDAARRLSGEVQLDALVVCST